MIKKTDVYDFVKKVERKAIKSIDEKYQIDLTNAIEIEINKEENKAIKNAITQIELSISTGMQAKQTIQKFVPRFDKYNNLFDCKNVKQNLFERGWNFPEGFDGVLAVHAEYADKKDKIEKEYAKIMRICQNKKTGDQGRTALIALGFDVTWLNNLENLPVALNPATVDIDKSLLFPCGESGL